MISKLDLADMNYAALKEGLYEEVTNVVQERKYITFVFLDH